MAVDSKYKQSELTDGIIGVSYDVYNELGFGFLESVYRKAMRLALLEKGFTAQEEMAVSVIFHGKSVGDFKADLLVNNSILIELKTAEALGRAHEAQVLNYLRATSLELGLLFNFGPKPEVRRLLLDNSRKHYRRPASEDISEFRI